MNFHNRHHANTRTGHLYLCMSGASDGVIDVIMQPIVVFKFGGTISSSDFFDVNPVQNIANLLGIDPAKIRIANIVRENSNRLDENNVEVDIDIGPGFQESFDSDSDKQDEVFKDVASTASNLQDRIREDKLPKDQGFSADEAVVAVLPSPPADEVFFYHVKIDLTNCFISYIRSRHFSILLLGQI